MLPEFKKILYATDMSESSRPALRYALSLARHYSGRVTILHVMRSLPSYVESMAGIGFNREKTMARSRDALAEDVASFCDKETCDLDDGAQAVEATMVEEGQPGWKILEVAEKMGVDAIVLGHHGRSALADAMIMGGTARTVVQNAKIPVLTVHI